MKSIGEMIERLATTPPAHIVSTAAKLLAEGHDWRRLVSEHLTQLPSEQLVRMVLDANTPEVQPRVFMVGEVPGHLRVILHHFDLREFTRLLSERRIGPHYHHFSFATRILNGSYSQWVFKNSGSLAQPVLGFERHMLCSPMCVYTLHHDRFHSVMQAEDDTVTLMIRGPAVRNPGHLPEPGYGARQILALRDRLLDILADGGPLGATVPIDIGPEAASAGRASGLSTTSPG